MCHKVSEKLVCNIDAIKQKRYVLICSRVVTLVSLSMSMDHIEGKHDKEEKTLEFLV